MFNATETKLDISQEMDAGRIVVIDNSKAKLENAGSAFYGRFFLALIRSAAQRRSLHKGTKLPCYVYIDEAHNVIAKDEHISEIIAECHSQNIALIMAHQWIRQIESPSVLAALTNCAIRYANSDDDAHYLADKIRTSADNLRTLPKGTFATFIRGLPPTIALQIPLCDLSTRPQLTPDEQDTLRQRMRADYGFNSCTPEQPKAFTPLPTDPVLRDHRLNALLPPFDGGPPSTSSPSSPATPTETSQPEEEKSDPGEPASGWKL